MHNTVSSGYPVLTPAYGLGSYGRTGPAIAIGSPRNKIGSQNRIYSWFKTQNRQQEYEKYLIGALGLQYAPRVNPWTYI